MFSFRCLLLTVILLTFFSPAFSQPGKDGAKTIAGANSIINEYTSLTADAAAGSSLVTVSQPGLNTNSRFPAVLSAGDLVMIYQAAGASVSGSFYTSGSNTYGLPKDSAWGGITSYNGAGNYEWQTVAGVLGSTILLQCPLQNSYTVAGKTQVIRIPRYTTLTLNAAGSVTCDIWNGTLGGVVAAEVQGNCVINGSITATAKGFRGGAASTVSAILGAGDVASTDNTVGSDRGEGIAGYGTDLNYVGGRYGRGAAANAGGGGTAHNGGGGGGANGGNPLNYNGYGVPNLSNAAWNPAWNLLVPGFVSTSSSGGGIGGLSASSNNQNALTVPPGDPSWGGDLRRRVGGYGGRPLDYSGSRLFIGGGGGAGNRNDAPASSTSGSGGRGGGIVFLFCSGTISGSGSITANGQAGTDASWTATGFNTSGQDGAGGGGGGGCIVIDGTSSVSLSSVSAAGGNGGNQVIGGFNAAGYSQVQGPGGGGGGGYVKLPTSTLTPVVTGGTNGVTNASSMSEFTPNGATKGGAGTTNNFTLQTFTLPNDTVCSGQPATFTVSGTPGNSFTYQWYDAAVNGNLLGSGSTFVTAPITANTDFYVQICPLHYRLRVKAVVQSNVLGNVAGSDQQTCTDQVLMAATLPASSTGVWSVAAGSGNFSNPNDPLTQISNLSTGINRFVWTVSGSNCLSGTDTVAITRLNAAPAAFAGNDQTLCANSIALNGSTSNGLASQWTVLSGSATLSSPNANTTTATGLAAGINRFEYAINPGNGCPSSRDTIQVVSILPPSAANAGADQTVCSSTSTLQGQSPATGTATWTLLPPSTANISNPSLVNASVSNLSSGNNVFILTISQNGCPSTHDTVIINRTNTPPAANAGSNQLICGTQVTLSGNLPAGTQAQWTCNQPSVVISNPASSGTTATNLPSGITRFIYTLQSLNGCPTTVDTVEVTATTPPSPANAGPDLSVCGSTASLQGQVPPTGNPSWSLLSGTGTLLTPGSPVSAISGLSAGQNIFLLTVSQNNCTSTYDTVIVTSVGTPPQANAGTDASVCGNSYLLQALSPTPANGTWTVLSGTAFLSNPSSPAATAGNLSSGTVRLLWSVTLSGCPSSSDTLTLLVQIPEIPEAGNNRTVCVDSVHLSSNAINAAWSSNLPGDVFQNNLSPTTVVNALSPGLHIFYWTTPSGICPSQHDSVLVNVLTAPNAQAGNDTSICGSAVQLHAQTPAAGNGTWSVHSGNGNIAATGNPNTLVSALTQGVNVFYWTVQLPGCPVVFDSVRVNVSLPPSQALAGANDTLCGTQLLLSGNTPANGSAAWSSTATAVALNGNLATFSQTGTFQLVYTISSGTCVPSRDTIEVLVHPALLPLAGADKTTCADTITLHGSTNVGTLSWSALNGGTLSAAAGIAHITALPMGVNAFVLRSTLQGCAVVNDTVRVSRISAPVALAGADLFACGLSTTMQAQLQAGTIGQWQVPPNLSITDLFSPSATITASDTGTYSLVWKTTLTGCPPATDTVKITLYGFTSSLSVWSDTTITLGDTITLAVNGAVSAQWNQSNSLSCMNCISPLAYPVNEETYYVSYTDSRGCAFNDTLLVRVDKNNYAELPTAFSPNNDGQNDQLYVHHNGIKDIQLSVYSEFGEEVFSLSGKGQADARWDGSFRGKVLMPQVLVYMLQGTYLDGKSFSKSGKIMLLR